MEVRFKNKSDIFNIVVTAVAAALSVGIMLYGVWHYGVLNTWPELVLNLFYIACLVMMWMYFFNGPITTNHFNYWSSVCVGVTISSPRHPFCTHAGILPAASGMSGPFRGAYHDAYLLLCPQGLEELYKEKPVGHLCGGHAHCPAV